MSEKKQKSKLFQKYGPAVVILITFAGLVVLASWYRTNTAEKSAGLLYTYSKEYQQTTDPIRLAELERLMIPLADRTTTKEASANPLLGIIPTIDLILRCNLWVGSWENSSLAPYGSGWDVDSGMLMCMNDPSVMSRGEMIAE